MDNLVSWSMSGYVDILGFFVYPFIFSVVIAYTYLKMQSATAAVAVILVIFVVFGNSLLGVEPWINMMYLFVSLVMMALVLLFLSKRRS